MNSNPSSEPIILALETSGMCGSIALVSHHLCIGEYSLNSRRTHSRRLLDSIDWLLKEAGLEWQELAGIAVSLGPGSFTGLRIGLSTAKGLAMAAALPLLGVAALDGLAAQFGHLPSLICPVLDARKNEVYTAFYRCDQHGAPRRLSDYMVLPAEKLAAMITEPVLLAGDGAILYEELFRERLGEMAAVASGSIYFPRAATIGSLALAKLVDKDFLDAAAAVPIYVRPSEAEMKWSNKVI